MFGRLFCAKNRGFTLVELLIVVGIIAILSTIGVPTFRRMIQKSKKAEAKVNLGALYTAELGFHEEYSVYGNNLSRMGFEIDGIPASLTYNVGFFVAGCTGQTTIAPLVSTPKGAELNGAYPAYYSGFAPADTRAGYAINSGCVGGGNAAPDGSSFTATAEGVLSPSYVRANPANPSHLDIWTIDQGRTLINTQDGVF